MKRFFSRNRKLIEIFLTLVLVFLVAGYYFYIYIPAREDEIIARRFRTLQRIEKNMQEKFQGYQATIRNCLSRANESFFDTLVNDGYNKNPEKFQIAIVRNELLNKGRFLKSKSNYDSLVKNYDSIVFNLNNFKSQSFKVRTDKDGKKLTIIYDWYQLIRGKKNKADWLKHITINATVDYREFLMPLLKKGVFDHYIVFNVHDETSNIIYEDFPSGISFKGLDSLFGTSDKIYTSRIIKIETGGEKYLAFLHPCGYNNKNDRIVAGLLKEETFDIEKRQLPERMVTTILFIALFSLLLLPIIRLALMGKKERIRFFDLFAGYFSFLLLVPVIILVFFWNNKRFLSDEKNKKDSKQELAQQISKSLKNEITDAYKLLDTMDGLYNKKSDKVLSVLVDDTINVMNLNSTAKAHYFGTKKDSHRINKAVSHLDSIIKMDSLRYKNTAYVFWMDSSGKEIINWAFEEDPPRGNYKERGYYKNVRDRKLLSLENDPSKCYTIEPIVSRIDGKFKVVLAIPSRKNGWIVASPSRFSSVTNPVLPLGYEFSITDAEGNTVFDSDTTESLNENLCEEFMDSASFKLALDTRTSREFETRHEDQDFTVLVQPISGLPYFIVILEKKSFIGSLYTQCISFTMVMLFSLFIFLIIEMILILIAHYRQTKLQKNRFDFSWIHPQKNSSQKYFSLFLFNTCVLIVLILFCFTGFSNQRLTEYIFLFIMAALITSVAAFAFRVKAEKGESVKRLKREKSALVLLSILAIIVLLDSIHYAVQNSVLLFSFLSAGAYFIISRVSIKKAESNNYLVNFRMMIFSRLLLTSGLPVIVFFNCIYNFEQRLEERLKLLDYAKNVEQYTENGDDIRPMLAKLNDTNAVCSFYTDSAWVKLDTNLEQRISIDERYSKTDLLSISLLKTSRLHYNEVSGNTEGFELIRPFGKDDTLFAFNPIFGNGHDLLKYRITQVVNSEAVTNYISLSSGLFNYRFPSIFTLTGFIFWALLFGSMVLCYQLLIYATDKVFGKNIPDIEEFKLLNQQLLVDELVKYLFVQGIPGSGKSAFIKNQLEAGGNFIFYDKEKQAPGINAKFFNLGEIPGEVEMAADKEAFNKQKDPYNPKKDNWYYKLSTLEDRKIECIVFTHFEYKIFDEFTNHIKLKLIEKMMGMGMGKKKIIISSDIDPVEYFYSLKKFMPAGSLSDNRMTGNKSSADEPDTNAFFEYLDRWNNLLGRFTNIYRDIDQPAIENAPEDLFKETFLTNECSTPAFLNNYKTQLRTLPINENNEEDYVLKIQSLCDHSYRHLLSSLTKEEQLTLYDLAEDGLVNTTNYIALTMLLNKGLIRKDDKGVLVIINRSFRNFILTVVNADEIKGIEKEINDEHTWNDYKYPVLIVLGALLYFVLSSNPEKFGNVLPVISGLLAGVPTIMKLLSFLKPGEVKD